MAHHRRMRRILAAALALTGTLALAAPAAAAPGAAATLKRQLGPGVRVDAHRETGKVRFVGTAPPGPPPPPGGAGPRACPPAVARAFLAEHDKAFGIGDAARDLRVEASRSGGGRSSVRFQQRGGGIPVLGGELLVNLDRAGRVLSASGETGAAAPTRTPRVTAAAARQQAIAAVAKWQRVSAVRLTATAPSLAVYDARLLGGPGPRRSTLVWRLEVKGGPGLIVNQLVLVDGETGAVALHIDQVENARTQRICDAQNSPVALPGTYPCTSPVAAEPSDPPSAGDDGDVAPAYAYAADTYDFYSNPFGRRGIDDQASAIVSTVDLCDPDDPSDCPMQNAFWDGSQMAYGDGFATADDVVGHELTHGVTDHTAHLFYYYQSGAINESLSDVMGEYMDQTNGHGDDSPAVKWQIGEDLPASIGVIRDMANPPSHGDPDSMTSPNYTADPDEADSGGVHTNSGVNNKAAFLIADGGTFGGQSISGLGITKAARIYYDVQTRYLTSGSDYADLASALPQACADNVGGPEGMTTADCSQVAKAVAAVRMSISPPAAPATEA